MASSYPELDSVYEIKQELNEMGVDVFEPESRSEIAIAQAMDEFSSFVLCEAKEKCLEILENDLCNDGGSVGELQGGNDSFSIYRVSFPTDECEGDHDFSTRKNKNAAFQLLREFNEYNQQYKRNNKHTLTTDKIKQYMLGMCDRRSKDRCSRKYDSLGNLMFILQFGGPTEGQVRHIDNMVPNLQICLYMSSLCPSTIVYAMDDGEGLPVIDGKSLVEFWERDNKIVPVRIKEILHNIGDRSLKSKWYTKYFAFWKNINSHLRCFGKLYQPVAFQLGLQTDPGTTLIAGGNEVHAGPPTTGPRMFAFAIGIPSEENAPEDSDKCEGEIEKFDNGENDGEVQYSPVLLHIDFCCLIFSILDYECATPENEDSIRQAKHFLIMVLIELIKDYPMIMYLRQIDAERTALKSWLELVLDSLENETSIITMVDCAIDSDEIFYTPDVIKRQSKKKKKRR